MRVIKVHPLRATLVVASRQRIILKMWIRILLVSASRTMVDINSLFTLTMICYERKKASKKASI